MVDVIAESSIYLRIMIGQYVGQPYEIKTAHPETGSSLPMAATELF
jgi:hypothetical protein